MNKNMEITISKKIIKIFSFVIIALVSLWGIQALLSNKEDPSEVRGSGTVADETAPEADKIVVVHFFATQQCWSCVELGRLTELTLQKRFPEEYESGKIEYLDINVDLKENSEVVNKYRARGSSLFINYIYNGEDNIEEDVQVWRYLGSEVQFRKYLGDKLEAYL